MWDPHVWLLRICHLDLDDRMIPVGMIPSLRKTSQLMMSWRFSSAKFLRCSNKKLWTWLLGFEDRTIKFDKFLMIVITLTGRLLWIQLFRFRWLLGSTIKKKHAKNSRIETLRGLGRVNKSQTHLVTSWVYTFFGETRMKSTVAKAVY